MTHILTVIGALEFVILAGLGMFALACWTVRLNARLEQRRQIEDRADWAVQLAAMTDDETRRWEQWQAAEVVDAQVLPLSESPVARRIRERIVANECRRFRAEIEDWTGGAA